MNQIVTEKVSIIIPTYNRGNTIINAINSILKQSYQEFEIIIIDDSSTDDTETIIKSSFANNVKIRYYKIEKSGAQGARLFGITLSTGKYLAFLDSDDSLTEDSLELRINAVNQSGFSNVLVYGDVITEQNKIINYKKLSGYHYHYLLKELSLCNYSTIMFTKNCLDNSMLPNKNFPSWQDDDMVLSIAKYNNILHCGSVVAFYNTSLLSIMQNKTNLKKGIIMMVNKYRKEVIKHHGYFRLFLWKLRILRISMIIYKDNITDQTFFSRLERKIITKLIKLISKYLESKFDNLYA